MTSPLRPSIRIFTLSRQPILNASFSTSKSFFNGNKCGSENLKSDSSFDPKKSIQDQGKKAMDSAASALKRDEFKTVTQKAAETIGGASTFARRSNAKFDSLFDKAKNALGMKKEKK